MFAPKMSVDEIEKYFTITLDISPNYRLGDEKYSEGPKGNTAAAVELNG